MSWPVSSHPRHVSRGLPDLREQGLLTPDLCTMSHGRRASDLHDGRIRAYTLEVQRPAVFPGLTRRPRDSSFSSPPGNHFDEW